MPSFNARVLTSSSQTSRLPGRWGASRVASAAAASCCAVAASERSLSLALQALEQAIPGPTEARAELHVRVVEPAAPVQGEMAVHERPESKRHLPNVVLLEE